MPAGSAPETRAVMDFAIKHPHIFTWLNLHTFGGVLIRPLGDVIVLMPPLTTTDDELVGVIDALEAAIVEVTAG